MTNPTPLSPAAQAVLDAFLGDAENTGLQMDDLRENVAAALRAVAANWRAELAGANQVDFVCGVLRSAEALEEIADELEAQ